MRHERPSWENLFYAVVVTAAISVSWSIVILVVLR